MECEWQSGERIPCLKELTVFWGKGSKMEDKISDLIWIGIVPMCVTTVVSLWGPIGLLVYFFSLAITIGLIIKMRGI